MIRLVTYHMTPKILPALAAMKLSCTCERAKKCTGQVCSQCQITSLQPCHGSLSLSVSLLYFWAYYVCVGYKHFGVTDIQTDKHGSTCRQSATHTCAPAASSAHATMRHHACAYTHTYLRTCCQFSTRQHAPPRTTAHTYTHMRTCCQFSTR